MTVEQMMLLSRILFGMMIFFIVVAIAIYFLMDVRKAWCILTGRKWITRNSKKLTASETKKISTQKLLQERIPENEKKLTLQLDNMKTEILFREDEQQKETEVLAQRNMLLDIVYIHTEVML